MKRLSICVFSTHLLVLAAAKGTRATSSQATAQERRAKHDGASGEASEHKPHDMGVYELSDQKFNHDTYMKDTPV